MSSPPQPFINDVITTTITIINDVITVDMLQRMLAA